MPARPVFRFAPSPNGLLHLGHACSALTTAAMAERAGGRFLLRIEDIDTTRSNPEHVAAIFEDLSWLGLRWEEPILRQSQHFPDYQSALDRLDTLGVLYRCPATRSEIQTAVERNTPLPRDPDSAPLYPGRRAVLSEAEIARRLDAGEPYALRLDMARALDLVAQRTGDLLTFIELTAFGQRTERVCHPERWGDVVLARKDTPASYHLCVVVDDARQGISHVTRGLDLYAATDIHRVLHVLLDLPPPLYHHHRLILTDDGRKLSKSAGDTSLRALRAAGMTADEVRRRVGG